MKILSIVILLLNFALADQLKVTANTFKAEQSKGMSVFSGNVHVTKGSDELNASKLIIYTDKNNKPVKYIAEGSVSFDITTEQRDHYIGKAQKVVFLSNESEYQFYTNVDLVQTNSYRRIKGDKVIVNSRLGEASAESNANDPVVMIFTIEDKKEPILKGQK